MKAVVRIGGKQYIVVEKETLLVDRLQDGTKELSLEPLMLFDETTNTVGTPFVAGATVTATVIEDEVKGVKLQILRFKSKKRVHKLTGHRQKYSRIQITGITVKKETVKK